MPRPATPKAIDYVSHCPTGQTSAHVSPVTAREGSLAQDLFRPEATFLALGWSAIRIPNSRCRRIEEQPQRIYLFSPQVHGNLFDRHLPLNDGRA